MTTETEDIGYLKAKAENTEHQVGKLFEKCDSHTIMMGALSADMKEIKGLLSGHISRSDQQYNEMQDDIAELQEGVSDFKRAKNRLYGIALGLSAVISGTVSKVTDLFN